MKILYLFIVTMFILSFDIKAQMGGGGYHNPDSLQLIIISGFTIIDTTGVYPMYYLDEDNDGSRDYHLNFGPNWYSPEDSAASRPVNGDLITLTGGIVDSTVMGSTIIVYEINGLFWRDPYNSYWNNMGNMGWRNGEHYLDSCSNSGFGWNHDSLLTTTLNGTVFIDSTLIMLQYYLIEENNSLSNYFLNFGPPWYTPPSEAKRPESGETVNIVGGLVENGRYTMLIVYEINGEVWRDSTYFSENMGGWIDKDMTQSMKFHTVYDEEDWIEMNPGWFGMGGMHDSLFCQILEIFPGAVNPSGNENAFAAYEINFYFRGMMGEGMQSGMGCGSRMQFNSAANLQLHYTDEQLVLYGINEQSIQLKYWDADINDFALVSNAEINADENIITFTTDRVANHYILIADSPTGTEDDITLVKEFSLNQNFPNPFNPATTITYQIPENGFVTLKVYDVLGNEVASLVNEVKNAGKYEVIFDAASLASGVYMYKIKLNEFSESKKMVLMK